MSIQNITDVLDEWIIFRGSGEGREGGSGGVTCCPQFLFTCLCDLHYNAYSMFRALRVRVSTCRCFECYIKAPVPLQRSRLFFARVVTAHGIRMATSSFRRARTPTVEMFSDIPVSAVARHLGRIVYLSFFKRISFDSDYLSTFSQKMRKKYGVEV